MNATACEDRGADLFLVARGAPPDRDLAAHLSACEGCRADLERLGGLARDLLAASEGLAPLPSTRAAVLADAALPPRAEVPPPPHRRRPGVLLRIVAPAAAVAASIGLTAFVLSRGPAAPRVEGPDGAITITADFGGAALDGVVPGGMKAGAVLAARQVASIRIGLPVAAAVVLGEGTRLRISGPGGGRTVEILGGLAWFDPAPGAPSPLRIRAGGLEVVAESGCLTVELRSGGDAVVLLESGTAVLRSGGVESGVSGSARVDVPAGRGPGAAKAADPSDAAAWFARPEVILEAGAGRLVVTLRPEVPATLRIAPWNPLDPAFTLRAERPGHPPLDLPVTKGMLVGPPPPADGDGAFLLTASRSYKISVDAGSLGLEPGRYALSAVYTARQAVGLWRGTRSSKPVDLEVK